MRAAASLLVMLGRLRASLVRAGASQLMDQVAQAIEQFEIDARAAGVPNDQIETAKYTLAATADDIVQNLPTADSRTWTQYSMLVRFFNERMGGVRFFKELERAKQNPAVNLGVLEIMHACLSLGFEGVYRASGGPGAAQGIRRDLYETIRRAQPKTIEDLSPHWRGQAVPLSGSRFQVPVWAVAALAAVVLLGSYLYLRNALSARAETLALKMAEIHPPGELTIARETIVKPPPDPKPRTSTQLERIRAALAKEIVAGKVGADQSATTIFIRIGNVVLFPSGGAKGQRGLRSDRRQDRRRARPGARRHSRRWLHRRRSDPHRRLSVELRALGGARQVGRYDAEAGARTCRTARGDGKGPWQSNRSERYGAEQIEKPAGRSVHPESRLEETVRCGK